MHGMLTGFAISCLYFTHESVSDILTATVEFELIGCFLVSHTDNVSRLESSARTQNRPFTCFLPTIVLSPCIDFVLVLRKKLVGEEKERCNE